MKKQLSLSPFSIKPLVSLYSNCVLHFELIIIIQIAIWLFFSLPLKIELELVETLTKVWCETTLHVVANEKATKPESFFHKAFSIIVQ